MGCILAIPCDLCYSYTAKVTTNEVKNEQYEDMRDKKETVAHAGHTGLGMKKKSKERKEDAEGQRGVAESQEG